jgi:hypothetical protein
VQACQILDAVEIVKNDANGKKDKPPINNLQRTLYSTLLSMPEREYDMIVVPESTLIRLQEYLHIDDIKGCISFPSHFSEAAALTEALSLMKTKTLLVEGRDTG